MVKRLFLLLLCAGLADASCQTFFDYCYQATITNSTVFDLQGITQSNIEGQAYVKSNLSNVNISSWGSGSWTLKRYGAPNYPIILLYMNSSGTENLNICLNGSATMSNLSAAVFDTSGSSYAVSTLSLSSFNAYYRRNWTFNNENGSLQTFTGHNATLTAFCPTYSSFNFNLTSVLGSGGGITIQTMEKPKYSLNFDGYVRERAESDLSLKSGYYVRAPSTQYTFNLIDYTGQCNGLLMFKESIGDTVQTIDSTGFGLGRDAYAFLDNNTPVDVQINCAYGGIRDFGIITPGTTITRNIEVTNVQLTPAATVFDGGLTAQFIGNLMLGSVSLLYAKSTGVVSSVNFSVYDITNGSITNVFQSNAYNSSNGQMTYNVRNMSSTYYAVAVFFNGGSKITKAETLTPNTVTPDLGNGLPSTIGGITLFTLLKAGALLAMCLLGLGFAAIDAGFAAVAMLGWIILMSFVSSALSPALGGDFFNIPSWMQVVLTFLALALLWGIGRRHDE